MGKCRYWISLGHSFIFSDLAKVTWCSDLSDDPPKRYVYILILSPLRMWPCLEKRVLADVMTFNNDLEMRLPWITWVGPKSYDECPNEKQKRRRHRERNSCGDGRTLKFMQPQTKECLESPKPGREMEKFSPKAFQGSVVSLTPWFWIVGLQNYDRIHFFVALNHQV